MDFEDDGVDRINELFEQCRSVHQKSYPSSSIDFDELDLTRKLKYRRRPYARGSFADVYKGQLENGTVVAVKLLRLPEYSDYNDDIYKATLLRFFRELNYWGTLDHINIARMLGFTLADGNIGLVSLWHQQGNLAQYIIDSPGASKPDLVLDVAEGIQYLHTCSAPLVHGDLKAVNVLVDQTGIARLADFGISKQMDDMNRVTGFTTTSGVTGTTPWTAPELLDGFQLGFPSDIYSFAGVVLEVFCPGKTPYHYVVRPQDMILAKVRGEVPQRPNYPEMAGDDALWQLLCACWERDPLKRPDIKNLVQVLYLHFRLGPRVSPTIVIRPQASSEPNSSCINPAAYQSFENSPAIGVFASLNVSLHCSTHQEAATLLSLTVKSNKQLIEGDMFDEPQQLPSINELIADSVLPSLTDPLDSIPPIPHSQSHTVTAWSNGGESTMVRIYFPWRDGIAEISSQDDGPAEAGKNWVKSAFLIDDGFRVPDGTMIAAVNTYNTHNAKICIYFFTADNVLREWKYSDGWKTGLAHSVPDRGQGSISAIAWQEGGVNYRSVFYIEKNQLKEITKADNSSTWQVTDVGPLYVQDFTVVVDVENGQVFKRVFTSGTEVMTFRGSWDIHGSYGEKPLFRGHNIVGVSVSPSQLSHRFYVNSGGQIAEYGDEDGKWYSVQKVGGEIEPGTFISGAAFSRGGKAWIYLVYAVNGEDKHLLVTWWNGARLRWLPPVKIIIA